MTYNIEANNTDTTFRNGGMYYKQLLQHELQVS